MTDTDGMKPSFSPKEWSPTATPLVGGLLIVAALVVYRPWNAGPLDVTDFPEFIPLLQGYDGPVQRLGAVVGYFRDHGRSNILTSVLIVANWELFGLSAVGWQWSQAVIMAALVLTTVALLARLGFGPLGVFAGSVGLVVGPVAVESWMRLTGEPVAALAFLLALLGSLRPSERSQLSHPLVVALICVAMILAKEVMVAVLPLLVLVRVAWRGGIGFTRPRLDSRSWQFLAILGVLLVPAAIYITLGIVSAEGSAYSRSYGASDHLWIKGFVSLLLILFPMAPVEALLGPGTALQFALFCCGLLGIAAGPTHEKRRAYSVVGLSAGVALVGAIVYAPWPRMERFYALPFLLGAGGLLAMGIQVVSARLRRGTTVAGIILATVLALPVVETIGSTNELRATRRVNDALAQLVSRVEPDSVLFGVQNLPDQPWQGRGPAIVRYARGLLGWRGEAKGSDLRCVGFRDVWQSPASKALRVTYEGGCGPFEGAHRTIAETWTSFEGWRWIEQAKVILVKLPAS